LERQDGHRRDERVWIPLKSWAASCLRLRPKAFTGAKLVKGSITWVQPFGYDRRRGAIGHLFVDDDEDAISPCGFAKQLGFAPVSWEKLNEGGALLHARGALGPAHLPDLFKKQQ